MAIPSQIRQSGLALITVLLVVAIVATIATFLSLNQQIWIRQAENIRTAAQAEAVRRGAADVAGALLDEDARSNKVDSLTEPWARVLPPFAFQNGSVSIAIEDAQGRFNINNLLKDGKPSTDDIGVYTRLLAYRGLDRSLVDTLIDWMDSDTRTRPGGAEDVDYLSHNPPYRSANQALIDTNELRRVRGYTPKVMAALSDLLIALPERTAINVNTARPEVLGALFTSMGLDAAKNLARSLANSPLNSTGELAKRAPDQTLSKAATSVNSTYFLVSVRPDLERYHQTTVTLIHRPGGNKPSGPLWQTRPVITVAKSPASE
jgi:general secretion pathway protein K